MLIGVNSMTKNIIKKKSPGGRLLIHKVKKKPQKASCKMCGTSLHFNPKKRTKSGKYADRPYAGEICHSCLKAAIQG
jgi:ribosomal protein L34E